MSYGEDDKKQNWWEAPVVDATGDSQTTPAPGGAPAPEVSKVPETPEAAETSEAPTPPVAAETSEAPTPPVWQPPQATDWQPPASGLQPPQPVPSPVWPPPVSYTHLTLPTIYSV